MPLVSKQQPASNKQTVDLLRRLTSALKLAPSHLFTPGLANYVFFPLASVIAPATRAAQTAAVYSDESFESAMDALAALVAQWSTIPGVGMDERVFKELWVMIALLLAGPLPTKASENGADSSKGKRKALSAESTQATLRALLALMRGAPQRATPSEASNDADLGDDIDWSAEDPMSAKQQPKPHDPVELVPRSIVFHTLTGLLDCLVHHSTEVSLVQGAVACLELLLLRFLTDMSQNRPPEFLITALPRTASVLARLATSKTAAADTATKPTSAALIRESLQLLRKLLAKTIGDEETSHLRRAVGGSLSTSLEELSLHSEASGEEREDGAKTTEGDSAAQTTASWLRYTTENVESLLRLLAALASHDNPSVRLDFAEFLAGFLRDCHQSLATRAFSALEHLLVLAQDEWPSVRATARDALQSMMAESPALAKQIARIASASVSSLSGRIVRGDERQASRAARAAAAALELLSSSQAVHLANDKWAYALVGSLAFRPLSSQTGAEVSPFLRGPNLDPPTSYDWPILPMVNIHDGQARSSLETLWQSVGRFVDDTQLRQLVDECTAIATRKSSQSPAALWILTGLTSGLSLRKPSKARRRLAKQLVRAALDLNTLLDAAESDSPASADTTTLVQSSGDEPDVLVERHKGPADASLSLDKLTPTTRRDAAATTELQVALNFRLLSNALLALEDGAHMYQPEVLYMLLAGASQTRHVVVQTHAQCALDAVAHAWAYASTANMVLSHADYVINAVSQRLTIARLDAQAPLVLIEMIRLVGAPIAPMVRDLVEDVFEALDDYHGYDRLAASLWAVLDALIGTMSEDVDEQDVPPPEDKFQPASSFVGLAQWLADRRKPAKDFDASEASPGVPFGDTVEKPEDNGGEGSDTPQPSPTQAAAIQTISKAVHYLGHPSSFLRARLMLLIAAAVPILMRQSARSTCQSHVLPVIHRAWPLIVVRLDDKEPAVVLAATQLISALAKWTGDFMARRILDDAWPRLRRAVLAPQSDSSPEHRMQLTILRAMVAVTEHVPLKEEMVWDVAHSFAPSLHSSAAVQSEAQRLYAALSQVNDDIVWLALNE